MKFVRALSVLTIAAVAFTACDDNGTDVDEIEVSDFAGTWTATQFEYSAESGTGSLDLISGLNGSVTLIVQESGQFTGTVNIPNVTPGDVPIGGTLSLPSQEMLAVDFDATTEQAIALFQDFDATFTLDGNTLNFLNEGTAFDFGTGTPSPADLEVTLTR